jgi:uncharacterized phiE125 gp8 family phage protein
MSSAVTLAQAKAHLRLTTTEVNTEVQDLLDAVEEWVCRVCGIKLSETASITEYLDGGGRMLQPTSLPVISVTSITDERTDAAVSADAYDVAEWGIYRALDQQWTLGTRRYKVVYKGGYGGTGTGSKAIPAGVRLAILTMLGRMWDARSGQSAESNEASMSFEAVSDGAILALLDPYRMSRC